MKLIKWALVASVIAGSAIIVINHSGARTVHTSVQQRHGMPYEVTRAEWHPDRLWAYLEDQWYRMKRVFRHNLDSIGGALREKVQFRK